LVYFNENWQEVDAIQVDFGVLIFKSHNLNRSKRAEVQYCDVSLAQQWIEVVDPFKSPEYTSVGPSLFCGLLNFNASFYKKVVSHEPLHRNRQNKKQIISDRLKKHMDSVMLCGVSILYMKCKVEY
jgi:hypothetical protein